MQSTHGHAIQIPRISQCGSSVTVKDIVREAGVTSDSNVAFKTYITNTTMCGGIVRIFLSYKAKLMLKSLVLSKIGNCSHLWLSRAKSQIQALEQVQTSFIWKIEGMQHLNYWEYLQKLWLYSP